METEEIYGDEEVSEVEEQEETLERDDIKKLRNKIMGKDEINFVKLIPLKEYLASKQKKMGKGYQEELNLLIRQLIDKSVARSKKKIIQPYDL